MGNNNGGIGLAGLLFILFVTLKLTGVIAWSWWWVFSPMLAGFMVWTVVGIVIAVLLLKR